MEIEVDYQDDRPPRKTTFIRDMSHSILAKNDSPDLPFSFSINPYRGCEHGCIYCYARPSHEYLGLSAGLDFESVILVKTDAPVLLHDAFEARNWKPQVVAMSGNTDCYQPVERTLKLTRHCLGVFLNHRNPVTIITKNSLVTRDIDILRELARYHAVHVHFSFITSDPYLHRIMEPRTATPVQRLKAMRTLAENGIPVGVAVAPVIPGLTDEEIPAIVEAAATSGATSIGWSPIRLPGAVEPLFLEWLGKHFPDRVAKVTNRIREIHGGSLDEGRFGYRMRGDGAVAQMIDDLFTMSARRAGLSLEAQPLDASSFRRIQTDQMELFD